MPSEERACNIVLIRPSLLDEIYHRIRFSHAVARPILCDRDSVNNHHTMVALSFNHAAVINDESAFRVSNVRK